MAKLTKNKASTGVDIPNSTSSNDFMNYFTPNIDTIRDKIVTMQPSAILSHQIVYYRSPEEQFHSFSTIGEEELYKLVKSSKPTTCMLDPIPSKLLKEVLPEVIDPLLAIIQTYAPSRSLRSASERRLVVPSQRGTKSLSRTFTWTVPSWWNDLPISIRTAESLAIFKKTSKDHIFFAST